MSDQRFTRREFVRTTAAVAAGAPLLSTGLMTPWAHAAGSDRIRVGIIGCGGRGTGAAIQALNADDNAVLAAAADMFPDRMNGCLKRVTEQHPDRGDVPPDRRFLGFDAYEKVIASDVDVVLLTTPNHFRPAHFKAAVDAGKHVFCEKPMAVDAPGVRSMKESVAKSKEKGLCIVAGFCWRYSDAERATYKRLHDGAIGKVTSMHTTYHTGILPQFPREDGWSDMEWQLRNWYHFDWLSGDHIVEQACHSIDKIAWAMNGAMPVRATALGGRLARTGPESGNVYDHFTVIYEYDDGVRTHHTCRQMNGCSNDNSDYIYGEKGTCEVNGWKPVHVFRDYAGKEQWTYDGPRGDMYQNEHDALFAAIRKNEPINDGDWMTDSTMMALLGRMAAYTGQTLTWEQALNSQEQLRPDKYELGPLPVSDVPIPGKKKFA